jgi:hypothetical protein
VDRLLALPQFNGAAEQIWDVFLSHYARGPFKQQDIEALSSRWGETSALTTVNALRSIIRNNPFVERVQLNEIFLAIATLSCIVLWVLLFSSLFKHLGLLGSFFLLTGLGSVLGSMSRSMVRCYFNFEETFAPSRFIAEFVLGIVLAFVLFLILQLGGVIVSGQTLTIDLNDVSQFRRVSIAMSLVAFAASYLIETALERLRSRLSGFLEEAAGSSSS